MPWSHLLQVCIYSAVHGFLVPAPANAILQTSKNGNASEDKEDVENSDVTNNCKDRKEVSENIADRINDRKDVMCDKKSDKNAKKDNENRDSDRDGKDNSARKNIHLNKNDNFNCNYNSITLGIHIHLLFPLLRALNTI
jgi:hypothetical protein